eukprot:1196405-Rhodomonas_salina.4
MSEASRRSSNRLCVNPSSSGLAVGLDRLKINVTFTCELWCPPGNQTGPCITFRNCYSNRSECSRKEVALCHFQYSKGVINQQLRAVSEHERGRFLNAEALFIDGAQGIRVPQHQEVECKRR